MQYFSLNHYPATFCHCRFSDIRLISLSFDTHTYIYIYTNTHTHTHVYIYIYIHTYKNKYICVCVCIYYMLPYSVRSSRIRLLATAVADLLHPALSLAYRLMLLMVAPLEYPMSVSSHLCIGLPLLHAPFILPSITSSSIPPALTTCPKYLNAAFGTLDSSVHSGLMFSIINMFVFLSIHDTLSTLLQHHNSKASIFLLSCFRIVQVSAP